MEYNALPDCRRMALFVFVFLLCHLASTVFAQEYGKISSEMGVERSTGAAKKTIRDFVLYNYAHLADDIINGRGMYLETVYSLLEIKKEKRKICQKHFSVILLKQKRIPDFSRCIAEYNVSDTKYMKNFHFGEIRNPDVCSMSYLSIDTTAWDGQVKHNGFCIMGRCANQHGF